MDSAPVTIFWFRRDLRVDDNHGLYQALKSGSPVRPIFIFDTDILNSLEPDDARVTFIDRALKALDKELRTFGSRLLVYHGRPREVFSELRKQHNISAIYTNEDYEPYARKRDAGIAADCRKSGTDFFSFKDQVLFSANEVLKADGTPYRVFTPYSRQWLAQFETQKIPSYPSRKLLEAPNAKLKSDHHNPTLEEIGFRPSLQPEPHLKMHSSHLKRYAEERDHMDLSSTSRVGVHLRFGTISIRHALRAADKHSAIWLKELIWREFFQMILFHYPHTVSEPFDPRFKAFPWRNSQADFARWCAGQTGYPIVDAGMRELQATGFMHNRARMVTGSFLTKHLLLDWRLGERFFAGKLLDFELASNVGNWQWVAGCGVDAAPYFRIFNPELQAKKFDRHGDYVKRWVPEVHSKDYPEPMVVHEMARRRALIAYEKIKAGKK